VCERVYALLTPTFFSSVGFFVVKKEERRWIMDVMLVVLFDLDITAK
jgi:hypothetical protein